MRVVVLEVLLKKASQLAFVPDDRAVEELVAQGAYPPFGERVGLWCPGRDADGRDPGAGEDSIEGACELAGAVTDEEPEAVIVGQAYQQVPRGLGGPRTGRVRGDPDQMHSACGDFDDEQNVEPAQERGVDTGEVGGDDRLGLGADELAPRGSGAIGDAGRCLRCAAPSTRWTQRQRDRVGGLRRGPAGSPTSGSPGPSERSAAGARDRRADDQSGGSVVGSSGWRRVVGVRRSPWPGARSTTPGHVALGPSPRRAAPGPSDRSR